MATVEGLDMYLDFLETSSTNDQDTLETPRIDMVLQRYRPNISQEPAITKTERDPAPQNYDSRLIVLEQQLSDLLQKSQSNNVLKKSTARKVTKPKTREVSLSDSDSSPPKKQTTREREERGNNVNTKLGIRSVKDDKIVRSHLHVSSETSRRKKTQGNLKQREFEDERERRWKAEQAAVKLAEHVRSLQLQVDEWQKKHEIHTSRITQLNTSLNKERETLITITQERDTLQSNQSETVRELETLRKRFGDQGNLLRSLEEQLDKIEKERIHNSQRLRDAEIHAATNEREVTLQHHVTKKLEQQIHDLQELLATREKDHQRELERIKPPNTQDIKGMLERELEKERMRMEGIVNQHKERLEQQQKSYRDLEEEFRAALRIEATRYQQLEQTHLKMSDEYTSCKNELTTLKEKEGKASGLVSELTSIVKEQKGRMTELITCRQEMLSELREKIKLLESEGSTRSKLEARFDNLQQENSHLSAKVTAQESVIAGLREERKLWGQELALQGATLAQDRGRMEGQIETLTRETKELRDKLENASTSLRVKDKVIEDHSNTIQKLKEQNSTHKNEVSSIQSDWSNRFQNIHSELQQERANVQVLQDQLDMMNEEKLTMEDHLHEITEKEGTWKEKYRLLKGQWEDRISVITSLEHSIHQLQEKSKQRQQQIEKEGDIAKQEAREARNQLNLSKQKFKEQLVTQETLIRGEMKQEIEEKDKELMVAKERVVEVENEMRRLLSETANERKAMEGKFQRLSKAFNELQKELT